MTTDRTEDFYNLTFSQREGLAPLPEAMELESIPERFRQLIWLSIDESINRIAHRNRGILRYNHHVGQFAGMRGILWTYKFNILLEPHDTISNSSAEQDRKFLRGLVLDSNWHNVLTLCEHTIRSSHCSDELQNSILRAFDESPIAYFVENMGEVPTVIPRISCEVGEAVRRAIDRLNANGMDGATTHFRQVSEHINAGQFADSIADSIHAVESVACKIDPKSHKTLGPALDSLEKAGVLKHPALKDAFKKLYGYASDEEGVRHALVFQNAADVGLNEAIFMFGACASFAAYLTEKYRQVGSV